MKKSKSSKVILNIQSQTHNNKSIKKVSSAGALNGNIKNLSTSQHKIKNKSKQIKNGNINKKDKQNINRKKQQIPDDYIVINDCIYSANTFTERSHYQEFLHKVKRQKQIQRKSFLVKQSDSTHQQKLNKNSVLQKKKRFFKQLAPENIVNGMSLNEKKEMFYRLQRNIQLTKQKNVNNQEDFSPYTKIKGSLQEMNQRNNQQPPNQDNIEENQNDNSFFNNLQQKQSIEYDNSIEQQRQKFNLFEQKIQQLKLQLMFKSQGHAQHVHKLYSYQKLTQKQKQKQIIMIEKIKDYNMKLLQQTKKLFTKVFKEEEYEKEHQEEKYNKIQSILHSLHSFPSLESLDQQQNNLVNKNIKVNLDDYHQKQPDINHLKIKQDNKKIETILSATSIKSANQFLQPSPSPVIQRQDKFEKTKLIVKKSQQLSSLIYFKQKQVKIKTQNIKHQQHRNQSHKILFQPQSENQNLHKIYVNQEGIINKNIFNEQNNQNQLPKFSLKLDLRLDQVVFGQDHYAHNQQQLIQPESEQISHKIQIPEQYKPIKESETVQVNAVTQKQQIKVTEQKTDIFNINFVTKQTSLIEAMQNNQPNANIQQLSQSIQNLSVVQSEKSFVKPQINIPLILTKERLQNLQFERNKAFKQNFQNHIMFQLGCIEFDNDENNSNQLQHPHFTTLIDINNYLTGFYEFLMKKYLNTIVDNLNMSYGKSLLDKFYCLQTEGFLMQQVFNQMNNILTENNFKQYQREFTLTVRKCSQYEIIHNKAVFDAFTKCLNEYRPYYELQGQVYPWIVSEKGITFYQINEDNIGELFEKSKFKVIDYCNFLCGTHPPTEIKNQDQRALINNKRQEGIRKMLKSQINDHYNEWNIPVSNSECMVRLLLSETIYHEEILSFINEMTIFNKKREQKIFSQQDEGQFFQV